MSTGRLIFLLVALFVLGSFVAAGAIAAVPKPPPRFWTTTRCERMLPELHPKAFQQVICVGSGGPSNCRWSDGQRSRLYSQLTVFAWVRHANFTTLGMHTVEPGVVRSFTLATRARPGFARIVYGGGDAFAGWPAQFYMARVRLLGTHVNKHAFGGFVAMKVAKLAALERTVRCTGR